MIKSLLPEDWHKIVISIEKYDKENDKFYPIGTGFLIGYKGFIVFVTAKHIASVTDKDEDIHFAWNAKDIKVRRIKFKDIKKHSEWVFHNNPEIDIAVRLFRLVFELDDAKILEKNMFEDFENVMEGDDIVFLGFPLGISEPDKVHPVVRSGIVAYRQENKVFLIDANVFPGSSGSPVFLKMSGISYEDGKFNIGKVRLPKLIGMIIEDISYADIAISQRTRKPRVIFSENAGLGVVLSMDLINEVLENKKFQSLIKKEERGIKKK